MSLRTVTTRALLKVALEQADARMRLRAAAAANDPDPDMVLADIAKLTCCYEDAGYAIGAAKAVQRASEARIAAANATTHLPDAGEWAGIVAHFKLDTEKAMSKDDMLAFARAYRGLRR